MITFYPKKGQILRCDFTGFKVPEMVKIRPIIIMVPQLQGRKELVTVVPISSKDPHEKLKWHYELDNKYMPPFKKPYKKSWVKADMIYTVGFFRLSLYTIGKDSKGKRIYFKKVLPKNIFNNIKKAMLKTLG